MARLEVDPAFAERSVNEGFSGGEKKRHEILQMELLQPKIAVLDETDSGLDVDALRVVSEGVNRVRATGETGVLLITHYTRILNYIQPDYVHVFVRGRIVEEGGPELADELEKNGYAKYVDADTDAAAAAEGGRALPTGPVLPGRDHDGMTAVLLTAASTYDVEALRGDFPVLSRTVNGHPLVYLDNASSLAPAGAGARRRARVRRRSTGATCTAACTRSARRPPTRYESGAQHDRGASSAAGTTRSCSPRTPPRPTTWSRTRSATPRRGSGSHLGPGDEVCVTEMEHHSNLVPWQMLCERTGATLRWFGLTDEGRLDLTNLDELVNERTKVLAFVHVSQPARHANPVDVLVRAGPRGRRAGAARRRAVRAAPERRRRGARRRLLRRDRPQDARSVRRGRALGPQGAARRDAAVHRRRLDDRGRADERVDVRRRRRSASRPVRR